LLSPQSTTDKQGAAAIRSRELNILLNSRAMIVREVQHEESDDFLELFGWEIEYEEGGTESGFKPVLPFAQEPRLYRLSFAPLPENEEDGEARPGKRRRRYFSMRQVPPPAFLCFVLPCGISPVLSAHTPGKPVRTGIQSVGRLHFGWWHRWLYIPVEW